MLLGTLPVNQPLLREVASLRNRLPLIGSGDKAFAHQFLHVRFAGPFFGYCYVAAR